MKTLFLFSFFLLLVCKRTQHKVRQAPGPPRGGGVNEGVGKFEDSNPEDRGPGADLRCARRRGPPLRPALAPPRGHKENEGIIRGLEK